MKKTLLHLALAVALALPLRADPPTTTLAPVTLSGDQTITGTKNFTGTLQLGGTAIGSIYQPLDADLATYAGITPSANVQTLLGSADYAAFRTSLSLVIGTNVQAYDADLTTYAGITPSANVQSLLGAASYAAVRTLLALPTSIETRATDMVTTIACVAGVEYIFTPVSVTSGKTYRFTSHMWMKWATAATSGAADLHDITIEGPLTVDAAYSYRAAIVEGTRGVAALGNATAVSASTTWQEVTITGFFKATASEAFNLGLNIAGWDAGDVVTVAKGATMTVQQVD